MGGKGGEQEKKGESEAILDRKEWNLLEGNLEAPPANGASSVTQTVYVYMLIEMLKESGSND